MAQRDWDLQSAPPVPPHISRSSRSTAAASKPQVQLPLTREHLQLHSQQTTNQEPPPSVDLSSEAIPQQSTTAFPQRESLLQSN